MQPITQRKIVFLSHYKQWDNKYMSTRGLLQLTNEATRLIQYPSKISPSHTDKNLAEIKNQACMLRE